MIIKDKITLSKKEVLEALEEYVKKKSNREFTFEQGKMDSFSLDKNEDDLVFASEQVNVLS